MSDMKLSEAPMKLPSVVTIPRDKWKDIFGYTEDGHCALGWLKFEQTSRPSFLGLSAALLLLAFLSLVYLGYDYGIRRDGVRHWFLLGGLFFGCGFACCWHGLALGVRFCVPWHDPKNEQQRNGDHEPRLNHDLSLDKPKDLT